MNSKKKNHIECKANKNVLKTNVDNVFRDTDYDEIVENFSLLKVSRSSEGIYICNATNDGKPKFLKYIQKNI